MPVPLQTNRESSPAALPAVPEAFSRREGAVDAAEVLGWLFRHVDPRRIVVTTSFGMEGCCLLDLAAGAFAAGPGRADPAARLRVIYIDTDFLFPEILAVRDRLAEKYPQLAFERISPLLSPEEQAEAHGPALWARDPDRCCGIRKVEPLNRALAGAQVWLTALRRGQGGGRANLPAVAHDARHDLLKVCPLASWDRPAVWQHCQSHGVPTNPLHERGYPSLGCTHCTKAVPGSRPDEYTRLGRWSGTGKTECGLHYTDNEPTAR
ncbi:MAG: phosphoadenylyl-sulfate reductase [Phycisphaerae bacterium]